MADKDVPIMNLQVRKGLESDKQAISKVVIAAFGETHGQEISNLIGDLLTDSSARPLLSLVAADDDCVVGQVLFTAARISHSHNKVPAAILAPLSVHPDHQNKGIGGMLVSEGIKQLKAAGVGLVFVLGHPGYYPKYGFSSAGIKGFDAPYPIPPENAGAWMVQELCPGIIGNVSGQVICADALNDPKHWRE